MDVESGDILAKCFHAFGAGGQVGRDDGVAGGGEVFADFGTESTDAAGDQGDALAHRLLPVFLVTVRGDPVEITVRGEPVEPCAATVAATHKIRPSLVRAGDDVNADRSEMNQRVRGL
jgi:hypothetical protein